MTQTILKEIWRSCKRWSKIHALSVNS